MKVFLNDNNLDFTLEDEQNAGQILDAIEMLAESNGATIIHIMINGQEIVAESITDCYDMPLNDIDEMRITTVQQDDVALSLKDLISPVSEVTEKLESIPVLLQNHKDGQVAEILKAFADVFDTMCRLATLTCLFPDRFESLQFSNMNYQDFLKDFAPVLNEFENALKTGDTVLTGDLAEWELKPRLELFTAALKDFD